MAKWGIGFDAPKEKKPKKLARALKVRKTRPTPDKPVQVVKLSSEDYHGHHDQKTHGHGHVLMGKPITPGSKTARIMSAIKKDKGRKGPYRPGSLTAKIAAMMEKQPSALDRIFPGKERKPSSRTVKLRASYAKYLKQRRGKRKGLGPIGSDQAEGE